MQKQSYYLHAETSTEYVLYLFGMIGIYPHWNRGAPETISRHCPVTSTL